MRAPDDHRLLSERLEELLAQHLPKGGLHNHTAARLLGMSTRTLARNLTKEGTTYLEVVRRLRMKLTEQYLLDERMKLAQIAWLLGFEEQSTFSHCCKRWFGKTPLELRMFLLVEAQNEAAVGGQSGRWVSKINAPTALAEAAKLAYVRSNEKETQ